MKDSLTVATVKAVLAIVATVFIVWSAVLLWNAPGSATDWQLVIGVLCLGLLQGMRIREYLE